jgi:predicted RNase H-like HicB family nuclease
MKLKVILQPEEEGGYSVAVPALPGCYTQGETVEEALANAREAAEGWLEVANERDPFAPGDLTADAVIQEIEL